MALLGLGPFPAWVYLAIRGGASFVGACRGRTGGFTGLSLGIVFFAFGFIFAFILAFAFTAFFERYIFAFARFVFFALVCAVSVGD